MSDFMMVLLVIVFVIAIFYTNKRGKKILRVFKKKVTLKKIVTDESIAKVLGTKILIRNGIGFGFISTPELYDHCHIEIGFGRTISGYGDWGGGFDHASTSPLKIVIDKDYNIINSKTDSFYNSDSSKEAEVLAKKLQKGLGDKLIVGDQDLKNIIDAVFNVIPCKYHIGLDLDIQYEIDVDKQVELFLSKEDHYDNLRDPDPERADSKEEE